MDKVVRAIDVGYGNVKYVVGHEDLDKDVTCNLFPSRAISPQDGDIGTVSGNGGRNTVRVKVNDRYYEVGPDTDKMGAANEQFSYRTPDFCMTDSYMARMLGAFHYMYDSIPGSEKVIDVLVLGLPVNTYHLHRLNLARKMTGTFELPFERVLTVKDVRVFAQPFGGFFNYLYSGVGAQTVNTKRFLRQTNLIIDPGFYTFDWLTCKEMIVNPQRTNAVFGGVSEVIAAIAESMHKALQKPSPSSSHARVEEALRKGYDTVDIHGRELKISNHIEGALQKIEESVAAMGPSVGDGADIDNIILVGGGASLWKSTVQKHFQGRTLIMSGDDKPVFANVSGFQLAAERRLIREAMAAATA